jgi:hypothetical protein
MSSLNDHNSGHIHKLMILGESGSGKTGALASLAEAGYRLLIIDADNGLDILSNVLDKKYQGNVFYETCIDEVREMGGQFVPKTAKAWIKATKLLTRWKTATEDLGSSDTWDNSTIIVIDSLTMLSQMAMNLVIMINARLGKAPWQSDYLEAQRLVEGMLAMLYSDATKCHVIVLTHVQYVSDPESKDSEKPLMRGFPTAVGKALAPKIPRYFNSVLLAKVRGTGSAARRVLYTRPQGLIDLKFPVLGSHVKDSYPIETGLATIFTLFKDQN